jgi:superoxide dismutase
LEPTGELATAFDEQFGSFDKSQAQFAAPDVQQRFSTAIARAQRLIS